MGGRALIVTLLGIMLLSASVFYSITRSSADLMKNVDQYYSRQSAQNIAQSGANLAIQRLSTDQTWRQGYTLMSMFGGNVTVRLVDTTFKSKQVVKIVSTGFCDYGKSSERRETSTAYVPSGSVPPVVRGSITAFGPLDDTISDMLIDGRNWNYAMTAVTSSSGVFAVSTGAAVFVNTQSAKLGGTTYTTTPATDIVPAFPNDVRVVETNSSWLNGWPTTPDAALGYPNGTLKNIAVNKLTPGSQYVTAYAQLVFPLRGVTYIEVPNGTIWTKQKLGANPEGILVFHSPNHDAYWNNITTTAGPFKGLMVMDNLFHIHMDILGGLALLNPKTISGKCNGNANHYVRYSTETIQKATQSSMQIVDGISWYE